MFDAHYLEKRLEIQAWLQWSTFIGNGYGESNGLVLCRRVCRSSELITYCHSTFTIDKIAWKYRKTEI